jgi:hypothetical protein
MLWPQDTMIFKLVRGTSSWVEVLERERYHWPPSNTEVKPAWNSTFTTFLPHNIVILIHSDYYTVTFYVLQCQYEDTMSLILNTRYFCVEVGSLFCSKTARMIDYV